MRIGRVPSGVADILGWQLPIAEIVALTSVRDGEPTREAVARVIDAVQRVPAVIFSHDDDLILSQRKREL